MNDKQYILHKQSVMPDGRCLRYILVQTEELCLLAVEQNPLALEFIEVQTYEMCLLAVKRNGLTLMWVDNQTLELCLEAVANNIAAIKYVDGDIMLQHHEQFRKLEDAHTAECKLSKQRVVEQSDELVTLAKGVNIGSIRERRG